MTHFEYLESVGQQNIFDFLDSMPVMPLREFSVGAMVKVRYYADEFEYVLTCLPQMMEAGEIVEVYDGFCRVLHAGKATLIDKGKLILI